MRSCSGAFPRWPPPRRENLSALPAAYGADASGLKFLNQTSDYAQTLAAAAAEGRTLTQDDVNQLSELLEKGGELRRHLRKRRRVYL